VITSTLSPTFALARPYLAPISSPTSWRFVAIPAQAAKPAQATTMSRRHDAANDAASAAVRPAYNAKQAAPPRETRC
jgi:hypothetical protein